MQVKKHLCTLTVSQVLGTDEAAIANVIGIKIKVQGLVGGVTLEGTSEGLSVSGVSAER